MSGIHDEHGPDCTCGCNERHHHAHASRGHGQAHDHEHAHDHGHDHHDHDHAHAHSVSDRFETDAALVSLEAHTHEQAATVSLDIHPKAGQAVAFSSLVETMQAIAADAEAAGGVVGHIKAYARDGAAFAHASVTAADLPPVCEGDVQASFGEGATIQLVSIVLLVGQDDLAALCRACVQRG